MANNQAFTQESADSPRIIKNVANYHIVVAGKQIPLFSSLAAVRKALPLKPDAAGSDKNIASYYYDDKIPELEGFVVTAQIAFYVDIRTKKIIKQEIYYGFERQVRDGKILQTDIRTLLSLIKKTTIPFVKIPSQLKFDGSYKMNSSGQDYTIFVSRIRYTASDNGSQAFEITVAIPK